MKTIFYNDAGWVTERYPYDLPKGNRSIEVEESEYDKTLCSNLHFAWKVVNGQLVNERYEETPQSELVANEIAELKQKLLDTDYKAIKYAEGSLTEAEYAETKTNRQQLRAKINQLESEA